jgi:hypothetical protein
MTKAPPFCINCKHARLVASPITSKVMASDYVCDAVFDVVTGEQLNWRCQNARGDVMVCGRDGKLFEPIASVQD